MDTWVIGALAVPVLFLLLATGVPIGISLFVVGAVGSVLIVGFHGAMTLVGSVPYHSSAVWGYVTLPMFILMGNFALHAGIGMDAYRAADVWIGRMRGGLAVTTTAACALFGFASGSSVATSSMFTRIALPEMVKRNYDKRIATGCIAAAGTLAALIPPSGLMVIYSVFAEKVSLGKLLIGGIVPGLFIAALFTIVVFVWTRINPNIAPGSTGAPLPFKEKVKATGMLGWLILIIVGVLGGIYFGVFTPTEAGATGAFFAFILLAVRKGLKWKVISNAVLDAAGTTAMIFLIVIGAMAFARFMALSGVVGKLSDVILAASPAPVVVVIMLLGLYVVLGCFLDPVGIMALTLPTFLPVMDKLGVNPVWFGILIILMLEIGNITPPFGLNVFAVKATAGDQVSLEQVFKGVTPFFLAYVVGAALMVAFPAIILWLPSLMLK